MKLAFFLLFAVVFGIMILFSVFSPKRVDNSKPPSLEKLEKNSVSPTVIDYSASFAIFTNGTFRTFTNPMYHNLSPSVYIESSNPNIIHVKKENITWNDFFKTLPFKLTKECLTTGTRQTFCANDSKKLKFYINGTYDSEALEKIIKHGDQLLVSYGDVNDEKIQKQLQQIPKTQ